MRTPLIFLAALLWSAITIVQGLSWYPAIPVQAPAVVKPAIQVMAIAADNARATLHSYHVIQTTPCGLLRGARI